MIRSAVFWTACGACLVVGLVGGLLAPDIIAKLIKPTTRVCL